MSRNHEQSNRQHRDRRGGGQGGEILFDENKSLLQPPR